MNEIKCTECSYREQIKRTTLKKAKLSNVHKLIFTTVLLDLPQWYKKYRQVRLGLLKATMETLSLKHKTQNSCWMIIAQFILFN